MAKYRFRLMFFKCIDNKVIAHDIQMTNAYQHKENAVSTAKNRETHYEWEDKNKPIPLEKVEGFYLVHESLFDEILKPYVKEEVKIIPLNKNPATS